MLTRTLTKVLFTSLWLSAFVMSLPLVLRSADSRPVILFDDYHHKPPHQDPLPPASPGYLLRYGLNAIRDPDGYASLKVNLLLHGYEIATTEQPITPASLEKASILVIRNMDSAQYTSDRNILQASEIDAIVDFVKNGGGLVVSGNSLDDPTKEVSFDVTASNELAKHFGVKFNTASTGDRMILIPPENPFFRELEQVYYDNGCNLDVFSAPGAKSYGLLFFNKKPVIAEATLGKGRAVFISDSGTWGNGNLLRPESQNRKFILDVYARLAPPAAYETVPELSRHAGTFIPVRQSVTWDEYTYAPSSFDDIIEASRAIPGVKVEVAKTADAFSAVRVGTAEVASGPDAHDVPSVLMNLQLPGDRVKAGDRWTVHEALPFLPPQLSLEPKRWLQGVVHYRVRSVSGLTANIEALALLPGVKLELGDLLDRQFWSVHPEVSTWDPRGAEAYETTFEVDLAARKVLKARADLSSYVWYTTNIPNVEIESNTFSITSRRLTLGD